jgi:hypothetical protein
MVTSAVVPGTFSEAVTITTGSLAFVSAGAARLVLRSRLVDYWGLAGGGYQLPIQV